MNTALRLSAAAIVAGLMLTFPAGVSAHGGGGHGGGGGGGFHGGGFSGGSFHGGGFSGGGYHGGGFSGGGYHSSFGGGGMRSHSGFSAPHSYSYRSLPANPTYGGLSHTYGTSTPRSFNEAAPRSFNGTTPHSFDRSAASGVIGRSNEPANHVRTTQSFGNLGALSENTRLSHNGGRLTAFGDHRGVIGGREAFERGEWGEHRHGVFPVFGDFYPFGFCPFSYPDIYPTYLSCYGMPAYADMPYYYDEYSPDIYGYGYGYPEPYGGEAIVSSSGGYEPALVAGASSGNSTGEQYYTDALAAFRRGDYQATSRLDAHAMIDLPRDARTHELMSLVMFALGNFRGAALEAHAALILGPVADASTLYSYYNNEMPVYTKQLDALKKYVQDNPTSLEGRFVLAYHDLMAGHKAEATEILTQIAAKVPQDKVAADLLKQLQGGTTEHTAAAGDLKPAGSMAARGANGGDSVTVKH